MAVFFSIDFYCILDLYILYGFILSINFGSFFDSRFICSFLFLFLVIGWGSFIYCIFYVFKIVKFSHMALIEDYILIQVSVDGSNVYMLYN